MVSWFINLDMVLWFLNLGMVYGIDSDATLCNGLVESLCEVNILTVLAKSVVVQWRSQTR